VGKKPSPLGGRARVAAPMRVTISATAQLTSTAPAVP